MLRARKWGARATLAPASEPLPGHWDGGAGPHAAPSRRAAYTDGACRTAAPPTPTPAPSFPCLRATPPEKAAGTSFNKGEQVVEVDGKKVVVDKDGTLTLYGGAESAAVVARETAEVEYFTGERALLCSAWPGLPAGAA